MVPLMNVTELEVSNPFPTEVVVPVVNITPVTVGNKKKHIKAEAMYPPKLVREKGSLVWDYSECMIPKQLSRMDGKHILG
jgi:hypothetical protein